MNSVNTAMQVRLYKQKQSSVVPECFKASLKQVQQLAKLKDFDNFKQKATKLTDQS
jgi:hypothetical protein